MRADGRRVPEVAAGDCEQSGRCQLRRMTVLIAYYSNGRVYEIYVMNADGSNRVQLTDSNDINPFGIDWSPDGSKLVFVSNRQGDDEIYEGTLVTRP